MEAVAELATSGRAASVPPAVDLDYETYAAAEAEMGWYNGRAELVTDDDTELDPEAVAMDLAMELSRRVGSDLIHGKVLVTTETGSIKVSVVGGVLQADVTREGDESVPRLGLTVNLRATVDPDELARIAREAMGDVAAERARVTAYESRSLIPGAPVPEHRIV